MTPAQRKAAERKRKKEAGLVQKEVWIRPEHSQRLANYVRKLQ